MPPRTSAMRRSDPRGHYLFSHYISHRVTIIQDVCVPDSNSDLYFYYLFVSAKIINAIIFVSNRTPQKRQSLGVYDDRWSR